MFTKSNFTKSNTPPCVFIMFFNWAHGTKSRNALYMKNV